MIKNFYLSFQLLKQVSLTVEAKEIVWLIVPTSRIIIHTVGAARSLLILFLNLAFNNPTINVLI